MEIGEGEPREKDIVWAKIKGYPWWPGTIRSISYNNKNNNKRFAKKKIYTIDFIGNKSHGEVSKNDINLFKQNYEEHCKTKNPSLIKSIELAKKLYQEKTKNKNMDVSEEKETKDDERMTARKSQYMKNEEKNNEYNLLCRKRKDMINLDEDKKKEEAKLKRNNDIKINININVTNNNQRTVNINSFSNKDVNERKKKRRKKNKGDNKNNDDEEYIFEEEEESEDNDNEDNEEYDFDEESLENELLDIKKTNYKRYYKLENAKTYNNIMNQRTRKKKKLIQRNIKDDKDKKSYKSNDISDDVDLDMSFTKNNEELNKIIQNLINYQIQISNTQNQKLIIKELNNLQIAMKDSTCLNIYYSELYRVLSTFTYNKNSDIVLKSTDILSNLTNKIISDVFFLSEEEKNILLTYNNNEEPDEIIYNNSLELKKICDYILNKDNLSEEISIKSKKNKPKKNLNDNNNNNNIKDTSIKDNSIKDESFLSSDSNYNNNINNINNNNDDNIINNKNFCDNIINIIINDLSDNFYNLSENFFKNIYNKNDIGLDKNLAIKRKFVCIKLFSLFKKVFPKLDEEYLKKIILFFEYKIRAQDPSLGEKYTKEIDDLFYKVKNINTQK